MVLADSLEAMLARGQDSALLRYGLGGEYLKLKQFDKAIEHLRKALQHDPKYSAAWKLLGESLTEAGNADAAIRVYEDGIRIAEENGDKQTAREMAVFLKRLRK
ncbi:MAG TPA: tetratricopeptide repeat protein [Burkholderiales bacterium]|nr:tetratricopeptide repeat protein [Burkholderiales bacterium]